MMHFSFPKDKSGKDYFIDLKGSKSVINRLILLSLYHKRPVTIKNVNVCNDVKEVLRILSLLNIKYFLNNDDLEIYPTDSYIKKSVLLEINESGTALRFMLPYLAIELASKLKDKNDFIKINLGERLSKRPVFSLIKSLKEAGASIEKNDDVILINKIIAKNNYNFHIDSEDSSQFLTSLLLFSSQNNISACVTYTKKLVSKSYIKTSLEAISLFNKNYKVNDKLFDFSEKLKLTNEYNKKEIYCDPDYSTAAYFWIYGFLTGKRVFVKRKKSVFQPDYRFINTLKKLGAVEISNLDYVSCQRSSNQFSNQPLSFYMHNLPDQIISLAFLALFFKNDFQIYGISTLDKKESNRLNVIKENLENLACECTITNNSIIIKKNESLNLVCQLKTYNDHRFAMIFLVLKYALSLYYNVSKLEIDNLICIEKSYPDFVKILNRIHNSNT